MTTRLDEAQPVAERRADAPRLFGRFRATLLGLGIGVLTYITFAHGWVEGPWALAFGVAALVVVPSAPTLSGRLALNGALFIGWAPLLWWTRALAEVDHVALLMALVSGVGAGCLVWKGVSAEVVQVIRPAVGRLDLLLPAGVVASLVTVQHFAFASTPARALELLLPGTDNHVHVSLFIGLRSHGAVLSAMPPPADGSSWTWTGYPVGFHALVATLSELLDPTVDKGAAAVLSYTHALAALVVLCVVILTAAVLSIGRLRRRPLLAVVAVVGGWSAFLWDPGQKALSNGFGNFWFAAAAAAAALLMGFAPVKAFGVLHAAVVGGLLVAAAHGWLLLVVPAAPAAVSVLVDGVTWARKSPVTWRGVVGLLLVALATITCGLQAFLLARSEKTLGELVSEPGGLNGTSPLPTFVLLLLALVFYPVATRGLRRDSSAPGVGRRVRPWVLVAAASIGSALGAALLMAQLEVTGTSSYYFLKYLMGLELILAATVPAAAAVVMAQALTAHRRRMVNLVAVTAGTLAMSQLFGAFHPGAGLLLDENDGGTANIHAPYSRRTMSAGILQAAGHNDLLHTDYLAVGREGAVQAFYPDGWYHAMDASLTTSVYERLALMRRPVDSDAEAALVTRNLLEQSPRLRVVVAPEHVRAIRTKLRGSGLEARVVTWASGQ